MLIKSRLVCRSDIIPTAYVPAAVGAAAGAGAVASAVCIMVEERKTKGRSGRNGTRESR